MRKMIIILMLSAVIALTLLGCVLADRGTKQIGGYFDENIVLSAWTEDDGPHLILFNHTLF